MEIKTDVSLSNFRTETRAWLELNCPESMRQPIKDPSDLYWGGRNAKFKSEDQRLWFEKMFAHIHCYQRKSHLLLEHTR